MKILRNLQVKSSQYDLKGKNLKGIICNKISRCISLLTNRKTIWSDNKVCNGCCGPNYTFTQDQRVTIANTYSNSRTKGVLIGNKRQGAFKAKRGLCHKEF